ncbi:unnamed protein product, partial [Closterium sp. NIES-64]
MGGDLTAAEEGTTAEEREARMVGIASRVGGKKIAWGLVGHVDETCLLSPYLLAYLFPPALLSVSLEEEGEGKGEGEEGEGEAGASFAVMEPSLNMWDISVCRGFIDSFPLTMLYRQLAARSAAVDNHGKCPFCCCKVWNALDMLADTDALSFAVCENGHFCGLFK